MRASNSPVTKEQLDVAWLIGSVQRDRALDSLPDDGVRHTVDGRFALAGEESSP